MKRYHIHKHKLSDLFGIQIIKLGFFFKKTASKLKITDRLFERLSHRYNPPKHVEYKVIYDDHVRIETIKHKDRQEKHCLLQLHGGAYIYGFNNNYRRMAEMYLKVHPDFKVYSPFYSLAPEDPFPTALEEMLGVYKRLLEYYKAENIVFTGDSAGGGLALALAYEIYDQGLPLPNSIITMSPWTDLAGEGESYKENKDKDIFFTSGDTLLNKKAYAGNHSLKNDRISPKYGDYSKLPDLLMFIGGNELIKSDTLSIGLKHEKAIVHEFSKMFHVFPMGFNLIASSRKSWRIIEAYLQKQLNTGDKHVKES